MLDDKDIERAIAKNATTEGTFAVAYALLRVSANINRLADKVDALGFNDKSQPHGAPGCLEQLVMEFKEHTESVCRSHGSVASALQQVAEAIEKRGEE